MFGGVCLGVGLLSAGVLAAILDVTLAYSLMLRACSCVAFAAAVFTLLSVVPHHFTQLLVAFAILGAFMTPLLPIALETAAEFVQSQSFITVTILEMTIVAIPIPIPIVSISIPIPIHGSYRSGFSMTTRPIVDLYIL